MKKIIILICCIFTYVCSYAQNWSVGPKIGINLANSIGYCDYKYTPGVAVGAFGEYRVKSFAVEADLLYSLQGYKTEESHTYHNNYLILPIKAKLYLSPISSNLYIYMGPQIDFLLGRASSQVLGSSPDRGNHVSISLATGVGYKICDRFDLSFNYNYGSKILKNRDLHNSVFNLSLGFNMFK